MLISAGKMLIYEYTNILVDGVIYWLDLDSTKWKLRKYTSEKNIVAELHLHKFWFLGVRSPKFIDLLD